MNVVLYCRYSDNNKVVKPALWLCHKYSLQKAQMPTQQNFTTPTDAERAALLQCHRHEWDTDVIRIKKCRSSPWECLLSWLDANLEIIKCSASFRCLWREQSPKRRRKSGDLRTRGIQSLGTILQTANKGKGEYTSSGVGGWWL